MVSKVLANRLKYCLDKCGAQGIEVILMSEPWLRKEDGLWIRAPQIEEAEVEAIMVVPLFDEVQEG
ncbi:hypothetical protein L195_g046953, partial [Trifolium pratense]